MIFGLKNDIKDFHDDKKFKLILNWAEKNKYYSYLYKYENDNNLINDSNYLCTSLSNLIESLISLKESDESNKEFLIFIKKYISDDCDFYNSKLNKHFTVPYGDGIDSTIQAEEVELEEAVMDSLHKIVAGKQAQSVKFANGQTRKVDHYTASAITQVHKAVNDDNKKKLADMVHKSPTHFEKVASFAFSNVK
jgi:hypothetical protein